MYVLLSKIYAGPSGTFDVGDVITVGATEGAALVAGGFGTEVSTVEGLPAPEVVSMDPAGAVISVGDETADVRHITIYLVDENENQLTESHAVYLAVLADAAGAAFATTGGSTGIASDSLGAVLAVVAKKLFLCITGSDGALRVKWTDTGTEVAYLAVILPSGKFIASAALTNA